MTSSLSRKSEITCFLPFGPILGLMGCRGSPPPGMLRLTPSRDFGAHPLPGCRGSPPPGMSGLTSSVCSQADLT